VIGRSVDHTNLTVERIRALGGEALGLLGDVTAEADCFGMIKQAVCH
jgi:hypothetical protein